MSRNPEGRSNNYDRIYGSGNSVECTTCRNKFPIHRLYRCYYCKNFFCEHCSSEHFKKYN